jgi:hypothetical protein
MTSSYQSPMSKNKEFTQDEHNWITQNRQVKNAQDKSDGWHFCNTDYVKKTGLFSTRKLQPNAIVAYLFISGDREFYIVKKYEYVVAITSQTFELWTPDMQDAVEFIENCT